jgi:hypothetical protein
VVYDEPKPNVMFCTGELGGRRTWNEAVTLSSTPSRAAQGSTDRRLKAWAYAGFFFDLTAAAVSRAAVEDSAAEIIAPLVFLALVLASCAQRPASRMLAATKVRERECMDSKK